MQCPRCQGETGPNAIRCADCGAPLALSDEPKARPLDRPIDLERRLPDTAPTGGASPPLGRAPLAPASPEDLAAGAEAPLLAVPPPGTVIALRRARSGRRVLAWLVDGGPFALAAVALAAGLGGGEPQLVAQLAAVVAIASFAYQTLAHWLAGATLGKRLLGLRVVGPDGASPGLGRSALRAALALLFLALLGVGPLLALFTVTGRGLHDLCSGTAVVEAP
jgi:uncharacterized RDD family membrane protein YckC